VYLYLRREMIHVLQMYYKCTIPKHIGWCEPPSICLGVVHL